MFDELSTLGLPQWMIIIAAILWILKTVDLLDPILNFIKRKQDRKDKLTEIELEEKEKQSDFRRKLTLDSETEKKLKSLKEAYSDSYLLEQYTENYAELLNQLGKRQDFVETEVNDNLKILPQILNILIETRNNQEKVVIVRLGELFTQLDVLDRHLTDIERRIKNGR